MKRYIKPKITAQKIKMSFFLTNVNFLDSMNLVGDIYAQSANTDSGGNNTSADANNSTVDNTSNGSVSPTTDTGTTNTGGSTTNSVGPGDCIASAIEANGGCAMCYGVGNCAESGVGNVDTANVDTAGS